MDDFEDKRVRATRLTADEMKEVQGGKSQAGEEVHAWYLADLRYPCPACLRKMPRGGRNGVPR